MTRENKKFYQVKEVRQLLYNNQEDWRVVNVLPIRRCLDIFSQ